MRTSSIRLRANARLAILHEDYLEICDGNMLAAMLLSVLVYWTDIKIAKKEENRWVWKTHEDFQEDLLFNKGMKAPHRTTISNALDVLSAKDFIQWRKNPKLALDRTRQYLVNLEEVQVAIDRLPPIVSRKSDNGMLENRHSTEQATEANSSTYTNVGITTYDECRETDNALSEKQHCNVGKPTSNTRDYITEITEDTKATSVKEVALRTNVSDIEAMRQRKTNPRTPVLTIEIPSHIAIDGYEKDDDDAPTEKRAAVKKGQTDDRSTSSIPAPLTHTADRPHSEGAGITGHAGLAHTPGAMALATSDRASRPGPGATPARRSVLSTSTPPASTNGAAQGRSVIPKRPRGKVTQAKPAIALTAQQQAFWDLWCCVWFNVDVPPVLNETSYGHVKTLAPHITTQEQMNSLEKYARKRLMEQSGISRREVQLGNCVSSYQSWKQTQQKTQQDDGPALGGYYYIGSVG
jgi:hypothetical protein